MACARNPAQHATVLPRVLQMPRAGEPVETNGDALVASNFLLLVVLPSVPFSTCWCCQSGAMSS